MNIGDGLLEGLSVAFSLDNLLLVLLGAVLGMVIGVLPGLGPAPTIALLLPLTYVLPPAGAVIMLAGIYYGAFYGGTITSVLLRIPGEAASVVTMWDGHQMALRGRAGSALGIAAIGSFVGGLVAVIGLIVAAPAMAQAALSFGPPEYAAFAALGLFLVVYLGTGSKLKSLIACCIGLVLATIGIDVISGLTRFTFGSTDLIGGIDFIAVAMGAFGLGEILTSLDDPDRFAGSISKVTNTWPNKEDRRRSRWPIARGSFIGFFLGMLPGGGGLIPSIASYGIEKRVSKTPERFGKGTIEGVAGPETANNAGATSSFIPLLTLGLPSNVVLALIYGALLIQGITPGPQLVSQHPEIFWGVIVSMIIGNLALLALSLPFVRIFVQMLKVRMKLLSGIIVVVLFAGVFSINGNIFDLIMMLAFGILGYLMRRGGWDTTPLVLAFVLGPIIEVAIRQSAIVSGGNAAFLLTRPVVVVIVLGGIAIALVSIVIKRRRLRAARAPEQDAGDSVASAPKDHSHKRGTK